MVIKKQMVSKIIEKTKKQQKKTHNNIIKFISKNIKICVKLIKSKYNYENLTKSCKSF